MKQNKTYSSNSHLLYILMQLSYFTTITIAIKYHFVNLDNF